MYKGLYKDGSLVSLSQCYNDHAQNKSNLFNHIFLQVWCWVSQLLPRLALRVSRSCQFHVHHSWKVGCFLSLHSWFLEPSPSDPLKGIAVSGSSLRCRWRTFIPLLLLFGPVQKLARLSSPQPTVTKSLMRRMVRLAA